LYADDFLDGRASLPKGHLHLAQGYWAAISAQALSQFHKSGMKIPWQMLQMAKMMLVTEARRSQTKRREEERGKEESRGLAGV
jgi:xylose isomerase